MMHKVSEQYDERPIIIISGPTAAGKSDLACQLAPNMHAEIVNADMGQLYAPLSIGTAKPHWRSEQVPIIYSMLLILPVIVPL